MTPIVWSSRPETVAFTAHVRIAPTAIRKMLTPRPIFSSSSERVVVLRVPLNAGAR
jgi:hypothetical protein